MFDDWHVQMPGARRGRRPGFEGGPGERWGGRGGHRGPHPHRPGGRGFGFPFELGGLFARRAAVRRGDVRSAILALLAESPMHGYQVMQELADRSGGQWRPSAGSVYPTLQLLEDEGLVRGEERDGRRIFTLTETGRAAAEKALETGRPWEMAEDEAGDELGTLIMQLVRAAMQVRQVGTLSAIAEARKILVQTRRDLYRLLADDEAGNPDDADAQGEPAERPGGPNATI